MSWPMMKMEEIFDVARGGSPRPIENFLTDQDDGINWIMIGDTKVGGKYIDQTAKKIKPEGVSKSRVVKEGDFLLTNSMSFGRPYILKTNGCIHDGWLVLSPLSDQINTDYFYYYLGSDEMKMRLSAKAAGAVVKNLNKDIVKSLKIPLPPLATQKKIAAILDAAEAHRQKTRQLLAKYDELAQSIFMEMFGDPVTNPKGWEVKKLGELSKISSGSTPKRDNESNFEGEIPWVKTGEVKGGIILSSEEKISKKALKESSCRIYPVNTILIAMYGQGKTRGNVGYLGIEATTNQACAAIPPSEKINPKFLFYQLKMSYGQLRELGRGGNQPNLNAGLVKSFEVLWPSIELQLQFEIRIKLIESQIEIILDEIISSRNLFNSLMQKAFKGGLNV